MDTQDVFEKWNQMQIARGLAQGLKLARRAFVLLYEAHFGAMPASLHARVDANSDPAEIDRWVELTAKGTREEVDAPIGKVAA